MQDCSISIANALEILQSCTKPLDDVVNYNNVDTTPHSWVLKGKISSWWRLTWKRFPYYWPFVRGIHREIVNPTHQGSVMWILDAFFDPGLLSYDVTVTTRILGLCASCRMDVGLAHYSDVMMNGMASQITDAWLLCSTVCSDKRRHQLCAIGLCEGNPTVTGGFPSQGTSNAENVSIWWRHHGLQFPGRQNVSNFVYFCSCLSTMSGWTRRQLPRSQLSTHVMVTS